MAPVTALSWCLLLFVTVSIVSADNNDNGSPKDSKIMRIQSLPLVSGMQYTVPGKDNAAGKNSAVSGKRTKAITNHELLNKLGMTKLTIPPSHSRKRLAVESRHHSRPDDSHMFVIKLPPNPYYYTNNNNNHGGGGGGGAASNAIDDKSRKLPIGFKSNGKPGRIYHWNLPMLKKIVNSQTRNPTSRRHDDDEDDNDGGDHDTAVASLIDIKNIPTWSEPWENESIDKALTQLHTPVHSKEKILKKKSPTYYAPVRPNKVHKYFPGNGKPKSFYVIKKKSQTPIFYQKLIP